MAHFAEIDSNNIVLRVVVIGNEDCQDSDGNESEAVGIAFCQGLFGSDTNWLQTSYNSNIRKEYAGVGFKYDADKDAFIPPQPYSSWTFNETMWQWEAPVEYPDSTYIQEYNWNEDTQSWDLITT